MAGIEMLLKSMGVDTEEIKTQFDSARQHVDARVQDFAYQLDRIEAQGKRIEAQGEQILRLQQEISELRSLISR